ncbi:MAG: VWA domain-containing protein [Verrucomicrobia bacterium]|nr:VWA domain-containing protein [Verrucomicrobiota bacterium]
MEAAAVTFGSPIFLWLLLPIIPALVAFFVWAWRERQRAVKRFIGARLVAQLTSGVSPRLQVLRLALLGAAALSVLISLARPQWGMNWSEARQRGLDLIIAIDTSRSMLATDVQPNRLDRAKLEALSLMSKARSDRLGIVAFAGTAFLQCPLTLDDEAFRQSLAALDTDIIPQGGTALAAAIQTATEAFREASENVRVLVLFTDGEDHEEGALEAARAAADEGVRIFTIGVGSPKGEVLRIRDDKGNLVYLNDDKGNAVISRLNEPLLRELASAGNGFYLNLLGADTAGVLYERGLASLPKAEFNARLIRQRNERFYWPLAFAMLLLVVEILLPERVKRRQPATLVPPALPATAALLALLLVPLLTSASPSAARRAFDKGDFQNALTEYERMLERNPKDPKLNYNAGNAAFRAGQFGRAAEHFTASLTSPDFAMQQSGYYNLGNALFRQGEATESSDEKSKLWERSLQNLETAKDLDAKDTDAKANYEFVKQKLEELKKQQQQQQQQQQKKDDQQQDQKNQQSPQNKNDQQKSEQKKSDQKKKDDAQKNAQKKNEKKDQQAQQKNQPPDRKDKDKSGGQKPEPKLDPSQVQIAQMTPQQAEKMLDAQRNEDRVLIFGPVKLTNQPNAKAFKNW